MRLYFKTRFIPTRRKFCPALATIIADPADPCPFVIFRELSRAQETERTGPLSILQHTLKVVNISTLDNVNS